LRFETSSGSQSQLIARWVIKEGRTGKDRRIRDQSSAPVGSGETAGSAALSNNIASLSRNIATRITGQSESSKNCELN
jgi:hypothetical protein